MLKYNYVTVFIIGQFANEKSEKKIKWSCWRRFLNCFDAIFASLRNEKCFYKVYKEMNRKSNKYIQNYSGTYQNKYLTVMYFALFFILIEWILWFFVIVTYIDYFTVSTFVLSDSRTLTVDLLLCFTFYENES